MPVHIHYEEIKNKTSLEFVNQLRERVDLILNGRITNEIHSIKVDESENYFNVAIKFDHIILIATFTSYEHFDDYIKLKVLTTVDYRLLKELLEGEE